MNAKQVIPRERYQEDLSRGYTILQWQPSGSKRVRDLRTGEIVEVRPSPMPFYRCMDCQYDNVSLEMMQKHLAGGEHPWGYSDGDTPYGPLYLIEIQADDNQQSGDQQCR